MINERKNILFLDMDGVLNSNYLIRKWCDRKYKELADSYMHKPEATLMEFTKDEFRKEFKFGKELIFPELAKRLNEVIETCNVKLIWSTSWRTVSPYAGNIYNARAMLERRGVNSSALIDYTPNFRRFSDCSYHRRASEIISYVMDNDHGITFDDRLAAIDDLNLSELENDDIKFFGTETEFGLTDEIKNKMIEYFKGN